MNTTMQGLTLSQGNLILSADIPRPVPRPGEVLVRVSHSSLTAHELELARSRLARTTRWLAGYRGRVRTGLEFSGIVMSQGQHFAEAARVMGYIDMVRGHSCHAEWIVIPETQIAELPEGLSLEQAATLPMSAQTAIVALRKLARIQAGQRVLIFGASGGVGLCLVQLARHYGAEVSCVARREHHEELRRLGASQLWDYREIAPAQMQGSFDAVFELSNTLRWAQVRHLLSKNASFIPADPLAHLGAILLRRSARWLLVDRGERELLEELLGLAQAGVLQPLVASTFALADYQLALTESQQRRQLGRVLLDMGALGGA